jgi:hypothetical protein
MYAIVCAKVGAALWDDNVKDGDRIAYGPFETFEDAVEYRAASIPASVCPVRHVILRLEIV